MLRSCLLLVALLLAPAAAHAVSFFDGVFNPADWGVMTGGSGASTSIQMLAGGNPDEYLEITNKPTPPVAGATVRGFHLHSSFVYDPGASGAIALSWDGRRGDGRVVPAGVYFYRITDGTRELTRKSVRLP